MISQGLCGRVLASAYKHALGHLLGLGLKINDFSYPTGHSPVPTPARHYIDLFLERYDTEVHGRCVEFMPPYYRSRYVGRPNVTSYDTWDTADGADVSIVGDLTSAQHIPDGHFDTIICTHVLCNVAKPWLAAQEIHRLLAPGGVALVTNPMTLQGYAPHPNDYWRFTVDSLTLLFDGFSRVETSAFGNAATVSGSPQYLMRNHFPKGVLDRHDRGCPSIVACVAWK
jgi:hypothetical protein